nr:probable serine/threonine-protein kinase PIX13 [Tanacetum cinerariifolium]
MTMSTSAHRNRNRLSLDQLSVHEDHDERTCSSLPSSLNKQCRVFSLAEIKLATPDFDDALVIGKGGFGKVYKGAARDLDYLHTGTGVQSRIIHRDIKSSNVLLDENFAAKISDFGTSRNGPAYQSGSTTNVYTGQIIGTFGYMDAEYFLTHRLTRKSDVYAFGVVLLEVLCGRPALDFTLEERQYSLAGWAKQCIKEGKIGRIIDPDLWGQVKDRCLKEFGKIAYECLLTRSKDRPTMTKVLSRLEFVLAWTLRSQQSALDRKYIGRTVFIDKALSLFWKKPLNRGSHTGGMQLHLSWWCHDGILGEGGFGRVFKGWLDSVPYASQKTGNGLAVAIKKFRTEGMQGLEEWQAEVDFLGKLSHPNIVKLFGYCYEGTELLLVYELMQGGSLDNHIFTRTTQILLSSLDIATKDFNVKLSDFGLCKFGPLNGESHVSTRVMGTYGYATPEYMSTGRFYIKSDVYGFGVVMLEIITGLRALDAQRHAMKQNLVDWVKPSFADKKRLPRIMDPRLEQDYPMKGDNKAAHLILSCLYPYPNNRPSMEEVVSVLKVISTIEGKPRQLKANTKHLGIGVSEPPAVSFRYKEIDRTQVLVDTCGVLDVGLGLRALDAQRHAMKQNLVDWVKPFLADRKRLPRIMDPRLEQDYPMKGTNKSVHLILSCLHRDPNNRPFMEEVVSVLKVISTIEGKPR